MVSIKFMKLLTYIINSKMILQVTLKGDKMATSHLMFKDHITKIPCTNSWLINNTFITFKVTHIIQVTCCRFVSFLLYMHCVISFFFLELPSQYCQDLVCNICMPLGKWKKSVNIIIPSIYNCIWPLTFWLPITLQVVNFISFDSFPLRMLIIDYY